MPPSRDCGIGEKRRIAASRPSHRALRHRAYEYGREPFLGKGKRRHKARRRKVAHVGETDLRWKTHFALGAATAYGINPDIFSNDLAFLRELEEFLQLNQMISVTRRLCWHSAHLTILGFEMMVASDW